MFLGDSLLFEEIPPISPLSWFSVSLPLKKVSSFQDLVEKKNQLPSLSSLQGESSFSTVYVGWSERGLFLQIKVERSLPEYSYPDFRRGDSIELFFDTRDLKTCSYFHSFCHHFLFFPEQVEGFFVKEVSSFRGEEFHPLVSPEELAVEVDIQKKFYVTSIHIPSYALHGFDPYTFPRMGFTYQINRKEKAPESFAFSGKNFLPEKNPHLWATFVLENL